MKFTQLHNWRVNLDEARKIQIKLSQNIIKQNELHNVKYIAGVDTSVISSNLGLAAIVIVSYPDLIIEEIRKAKGEFIIPYIPGLLSFREAPLVFSAFEQLRIKPDLIMVDGQGIAHPRRFGLASHIGLILNIPSIGCAKSRLCGSYKPVPETAGLYSYLIDNDQIIGAVLRTRDKVKPVFISIGHKIDLESSINWITQCCKKFRLPEPCRLAHLASVGRI